MSLTGIDLFILFCAIFLLLDTILLIGKVMILFGAKFDNPDSIMDYKGKAFVWLALVVLFGAIRELYPLFETLRGK